MRTELLETIAYLDRLAKFAGVSPILFGTTVLELQGIGDFRAADLDVIVEAKHGRALAAVAGIELDEAGGNDRFRSIVHFHLDGAPLTIDVMADMSILTIEGWIPYQVEETEEMEIGAGRFRVASLADLMRFYRLARRPKDDAKIAALRAMIG